MEVHTTPRSSASTDYSARSPLLRNSNHDDALQRHDSSYASNQGPGPATSEATPPKLSSRYRPRLTPHSTDRSVREQVPRITAEQTVELFTIKIDEARKDTQHVFSGTADVSNALKPTLTIDLGRSGIERLPDAIIDLIIADVERLSLSHNLLRYIPSRIADCTQLRYLNIRSNDFREIPPPVYRMPFLEILDMSKNKITDIPPEIRKLEALRVFSVVHNRLTDLPVELIELPRLKVLKVAENAFGPGIKRVIHEKMLEVAFSEMPENERDTALTSEIIKYLKKPRPKPPVLPAAIQGSAPGPTSEPRAGPTPMVEDGNIPEPLSAVEISRPPKRALSGRFPVVPAMVYPDSLMDGLDTTSQQGKPPSLPIKSHLRGLSGQSMLASLHKRPGIAPVVVGNERNRSNSESVIQASAAARQRRLGATRQDRTELDSIDETKVVRQSHLRGLSYGSALRRNGSISSPSGASSSPGSPKDTRKQGSQFVRRLSSLPEQRTDQVRRPLIEGAKGILYALYQVHPHISGLISANKGKGARRSGLEMSFFNASIHVDKLNKSLDQIENIDEEDDEAWERASETINNDCATCIKIFVHVTTQMQESTHRIVAGTDPRYVRSLMLLLYGSIIEVKNAIKSFGAEVKHHRRQMSSGATHPIATIPEETTQEEPSSVHAMDRDLDAMTVRQPTRLRSDTVLKHPGQGGSSLQPVHPPALQISTNGHLSGSLGQGMYSRVPSASGNSASRSFAARSRSNSRSTTMSFNSEGPGLAVTNTPRSADSYQPHLTASFNGRFTPDVSMTDSQEEQRFEQIFLALTKAYETALQAVPITTQQLERCQDAANGQRQPKNVIDVWNSLVQKSKQCFDLTQALQIRLANMKLKGSSVGLSSAEGGRHDPSFWGLCKSFLSSFVGLVTEMKEVRKLRLLVLPQETVAVLRPVQRACQEAGHAIATSPWNHMLQGVSAMPAPTPMAPRGGVDISRPQQYNRSANNSNSNISAYAAAILQQQNGQAQKNHFTPLQKSQLHPLPFLSSLPTPASATHVSTSGTASPMSATSSMPATPLSAALGPAAQATVPSTPGGLYGDLFFKGDVFQRIDSLQNMPQAAGVNFLNRR